MEDHDCVFFSDDKDFTFLHLLTKSHSFCELEAVALDPLAFGLEMTVNFFINFLQSHKVEFVIKGEVKD